MNRKRATTIIAWTVWGSTFRRISEMFEEDESIVGMQFSGEDLIQQAAETLSLSLDKIWEVQELTLFAKEKLSQELQESVIKQLKLDADAFNVENLLGELNENT